MLTREVLRAAVNAACTCGGRGPGDPDMCPACEVWHALRLKSDEGARKELKQERDIAESWRKVAEGFERDCQRLRAELESDGKVRARLEEELAGALRDNHAKCLELADKAQEIRDPEEALALRVGAELRAAVRGEVPVARQEIHCGPAQISKEEGAAQPVPTLPKEILDLAAALEGGPRCPRVSTAEIRNEIESERHTGAPGNSTESREDREVPP